jgi:acyl-CoA thioester hydrolase
VTSSPDESLRREAFHVTMGDVDAAGVLYFGAPLRWLDRLMGAWMREIGLPISGLLARGEGAPAVHTETDYRSPLRLDDPVEAVLSHLGHGRTSYTLGAEFSHAEAIKPAVEVRFTAVWASHEVRDGEATMRSTPLPDQLLRAF